MGCWLTFTRCAQLGSQKTLAFLPLKLTATQGFLSLGSSSATSNIKAVLAGQFFSHIEPHFSPAASSLARLRKTQVTGQRDPDPQDDTPRLRAVDRTTSLWPDTSVCFQVPKISAGGGGEGGW